MKKLLILSVSIIQGIHISGCGNSNQGGDNHSHDEFPTTTITSSQVSLNEDQYSNAGIELGTLIEKSLSETARATGQIDIPPQNFAEVSTYVGAVVKSILAIEGDYVKKGQVVMILEHPELIKLQEAYISSRNQLLLLEKNYQRQKELNSKQVASARVFEEAETAYRSELGRLSSLESQLQMLGIQPEELNEGKISKTISLRAPVSGYIGHIRASLGAYIDPNKVLFDVVNLDEVHLHLSIFEKDITKVKPGQKVLATIPNRNNEEVEARVIKVGKLIDENTRAVHIHADILNKHEALIPGLFVNALIYVSDESAPSVPEDAIVSLDGKSYIFELNDKKSCLFRLVEVKRGTSGNGFTQVEVLEDLAPDAQIVVKGAYYLISQMKAGEGE